MHIDIISVLPDLLQSPLNHSIIKRAQSKGILTVELHNLRDFSFYKHKQVDDYQFGGGAGMVLMIEPIAECIEFLKKKRTYDEVIYMTPDAPVLTQKDCNKLSLLNNIIILCGHYKGIDQRVRDLFITKEISVGSYVLSGGELPALILVDAVGRLLPGVLNDETSALFDSFQDNLLAPPVYTRPSDYKGNKVPDVLLSGDFARIEEWRHEQSLKRTKEIRPDLSE
jgi:tRNA (guanine37-N1)-methyltransferase